MAAVAKATVQSQRTEPEYILHITNLRACETSLCAQDINK